MLLSLMLEVSVRFGMETPRESATNKHVQSQSQKKYPDAPCTKFHARALGPVLVPLNELLIWFGMNSHSNSATNKLL